MNDGMLAMNWPLVAAMAVAGLALGLAYFAVLRRTAELLGTGGSRLRPLLLTLARIAVAALAFFFAARLGAAPLLAAFIGFLAARALALRRVRRSG
jgi:F1-F0 ATPase (N-ATPase) AtpR subunit